MLELKSYDLKIQTPFILEIVTYIDFGTLAVMRRELTAAGSSYAILIADEFEAGDFSAEALGLGKDGPVRFDNVDTIIIDDARYLRPEVRALVEEMMLHRQLRGRDLPLLQNVVLMWGRDQPGEAPHGDLVEIKHAGVEVNNIVYGDELLIISDWPLASDRRRTR